MGQEEPRDVDRGALGEETQEREDSKVRTRLGSIGRGRTAPLAKPPSPLSMPGWFAHLHLIDRITTASYLVIYLLINCDERSLHYEKWLLVTLSELPST